MNENIFVKTGTDKGNKISYRREGSKELNFPFSQCDKIQQGRF